jgi:hypothetical protein
LSFTTASLTRTIDLTGHEVDRATISASIAMSAGAAATSHA